MEGCLVSNIHEEVMTRFPSVIVELSLQSKRYFSLGLLRCSCGVCTPLTFFNLLENMNCSIFQFKARGCMLNWTQLHSHESQPLGLLAWCLSILYTVNVYSSQTDSSLCSLAFAIEAPWQSLTVADWGNCFDRCRAWCNEGSSRGLQ
jgi:hypothetical protein